MIRVSNKAGAIQFLVLSPLFTFIEQVLVLTVVLSKVDHDVQHQEPTPHFYSVLRYRLRRHAVSEYNYRLDPATLPDTSPHEL